mgnify:CR=1 FL=1
MIKNELNQKLQLTCIVCALLSGTNYLHANGKWSDRHEKEIIPTVKKLTEEGIHINGTVRDSQGEPLSGVNIVIKGQTIGTTTDIDGNYFLEVPSRSSILVFTYIGFEEQEIVVGNQININLNMHEISTGLNEDIGRSGSSRLWLSKTCIDSRFDYNNRASGIKPRDNTCLK